MARVSNAVETKIEQEMEFKLRTSASENRQETFHTRGAASCATAQLCMRTTKDEDLKDAVCCEE